MPVIGLMKKVKTQILSLNNHPVNDLDIEKKLHYLNGLALVMNEDDDIADKEKDYLSILINSFGFSNEHIESVIEFAKNPDEKALIEMMNSFDTKDLKYLFLFDCIFLAGLDSGINQHEEVLIGEYAETLSLIDKELNNIYSLYNAIKAKHIFQISILFMNENNFKMEQFQYILDYCHITVPVHFRLLPYKCK